MDKSNIMTLYEALCNAFPDSNIRLEFMRNVSEECEELIDFTIIDSERNDIEYFLTVKEAIAITDETKVIEDVTFLLNQVKLHKQWSKQFTTSLFAPEGVTLY